MPYNTKVFGTPPQNTPNTGMDAQELRNLQEAYMEVVMNEGEQPYPEEKVKKSIKRKFSDVNRQRVYYSDGPRTDDLEARATKQEKIHKKMMRKVKETQLKKEENLQRKLNQHNKNFLFLNIVSQDYQEKKLQIYLD